MVETAQPDARRLLQGVHSIMGRIDRAQMPEMDERVQRKYKSTIDELCRLGFTYLCVDGQIFPLFRLLYGLPLLVLVGTIFEGTPILINRKSVVAAYPTLFHATRSTFCHVYGSRLMFYTAFRGDTLLVSGNYDDPIGRGPGIIRYFQAGSMAETWAKHTEHVEALQREGREADWSGSYETYVKSSVRYNSPW